MVIAVRQEKFAKPAAASNSLTITADNPYAAGSMLHVAALWLGGNTLTFSGDGVNTFTALSPQTTVYLGVQGRQWYALNALNSGGSAPTVSFTLSASTTQWEVWLAEISGTAGPDRQLIEPRTIAASGTDVLVADTVVPGTSIGLIRGICMNDNSGGFASGTGFTAGISGADGVISGIYGTESKRYTVASGIPMTWTCTQANNNPSFIIATFIESAVPLLVGQQLT